MSYAWALGMHVYGMHLIFTAYTPLIDHKRKMGLQGGVMCLQVQCNTIHPSHTSRDNRDHVMISRDHGTV